MRLESGAGLVDGFRFYLETRYKSRIASVTALNYTSQVKQWVKWCEENDFDYRTASQEDIAIYMGELRRTMRQHTVRNRLIALRIFFDYCIFKGYIKENPARGVPNTRAQSRPEEEFTPAETQRMYAACRNWRERAIFLLFLGGGLRRGEIFGITRPDINFEQGTVSVLGKGSQYRIVAPGQMAMEALCQAMEFDDRLCPWAWPISINDLLERLGKQAGVHGRVHPHRFRHFFSTSFLDAGGTVEELQQILGHSNISQSLAYAKAGRKRRAIEAQARIDVAARMLAGEPREGPVALREVGTG